MKSPFKDYADLPEIKSPELVTTRCVKMSEEPEMEDPLCTQCDKLVPTIVRCDACNDAACLACAHEHFHYCDGCKKLVCPKCIATKDEADYKLCNVCVENKATEKEN